MTNTSVFPNKKYKVIYADPPWNFKTYSKKGMGKSPPYGCMNLQDIKDLPVQDIADKDCVLLMWTTDPFLEKSFEVVETWGFEYSTMGFVWAKKNKVSDSFFTGMGYWTRANPEYCLLAKKGKPSRKAKNVPTLIVDKIREHSRKPAQMYDRIEELCDGPYFEMFARNQRPGWDSFGNQTTLFEES